MPVRMESNIPKDLQSAVWLLSGAVSSSPTVSLVLPLGGLELLLGQSFPVGIEHLPLLSSNRDTILSELF